MLTVPAGPGNTPTVRPPAGVPAPCTYERALGALTHQ
jgi:hypothetical protein